MYTIYYCNRRSNRAEKSNLEIRSTDEENNKDAIANPKDVFDSDESLDSDSDFDHDSIGQAADFEEGFLNRSADDELDDVYLLRNIEEDTEVRVGTRTKRKGTGATRSYTFKKRKANPRGTSSMRQSWNDRVLSLKPDEIGSIKCCKKLKCFEKANKDFLMQKMNVFINMKPGDRRRSLASMYGSCGSFYFDGQQVCSTFLFDAFRFSRKVQSSVRAICKNNLKLSLTANKSSISTTSFLDSIPNPRSSSILAAPGREAVVSYLSRLAENTGDKMPDINEMHLPFHTKMEVYAHFKEEYKKTSSSSLAGFPSANYFLRTWKSSCRFIKVRKRNRFSKCDICERLKDEMKIAVTNFESTAIVLAQKRAHYKMVTDERQEYKRKRDLAILNPTELLSLIIDGADQTAYGLPHFISHTKSQRGNSLSIKLVGLLEHASENRLRLLTMTEEHQTGANHIVEAIHRFLMDKYISSVLPPKLFIQVDNCTRENKNRFFFSYVECLVRWKVFKEVEVAFLPVGHTHEDIDQAFSTTSARLSVNDAITLNDMHYQLRRVYNTHTSVGHMKYIINWSGLLKQENVLTSIKNFSNFRYFNFKEHLITGDKGSSHSLRCMVKINLDDEWEELKPMFVKDVPDLFRTPATIISSSSNKDFEKLKSEFNKRLESEETRIKVPSKIGELKELRDNVFRPRKVRFHWELSRAIELKEASKPNREVPRYNRENKEAEDENEDLPSHSDRDADLEIHSEEPGGESKEVNCETSGSLRRDGINCKSTEVQNPTISCRRSDNGYEYELNSFVAVLCDTADNLASFWIGKVIKVTAEKSGIASSIDVHWYEPYRRKNDSDETPNKFYDKYAASYLDMGTNKERPWTNKLQTSAVLINFSSLLQNRKLPSSVQRHLRSILPTFKK